MPCLLTVPEAATLVGVSQARVRRWIRDGMPTLRPGRRTLIAVADLTEWIRALPPPPSTPGRAARAASLAAANRARADAARAATDAALADLRGAMGANAGRMTESFVDRWTRQYGLRVRRRVWRMLRDEGHDMSRLPARLIAGVVSTL